MSYKFIDLGSSHGDNKVPSNPSRRRFIKTTAAAAAIAAAGPTFSKYAHAAARPFKIGWVTPKTGNVAAFAAADDFVLAGVRKEIGSGINIAGTIHPVEFVVRDTRSDPNRAAEVAAALIKNDKVDLLIAAMVPETTNPVADQAEINGVPCLTSGTPWQAYFFGRGGKPDKGFEWTYHFCWGLEDCVVSYMGIWDSLPTNKTVGVLFGNDNDGNAFADKQFGVPPFLVKRGFKMVDPGRFDPMTPDFSSVINQFKKEDVQIINGVLPPAAFATFWSQSAQQGFRPKICTMGKALLFPSTIDSLGERGNLLTNEVWWTPTYPFKSSLTGQTPAQMCDQWEKETGKQWTQPIGFQHSLMEVTIDVVKRIKNIDSRASILEAIRTTKVNTVMGPIQFTGNSEQNPVKNVCKTPLVGGQWVRVEGKKFKYELRVVNNDNNKAIPVQAKVHPLA
jgi:branched-chain amino acid transport system substrate-binding protein